MACSPEWGVESITVMLSCISDCHSQVTITTHHTPDQAEPDYQGFTLEMRLAQSHSQSLLLQQSSTSHLSRLFLVAANKVNRRCMLSKQL